MSSQKLTRSYLHAPGKSHFIGRTVGQQLYKAADEYKDKEMYVFYADKERITFAEMKEESQQFACSLLSIGVEKGDRIAVLGANHKEWLYATFACAQLGVILVQLRLEFPLLTNQDILKKMNCKVLLLTRSPDDILDNACEIIPTLKTNDKSNLDCSSLPDLQYVIVSDKKANASGAYGFREFLQFGNEKLRKKVEDICWTIDIDDPCLVYFTSGTTGVPKAALHSHHGLLNVTYASGSYRCDVEGFDPQWEKTRFATTMTFAGSASYISTFVPLVRGCTTVVLYPLFDVTLMAKAIQDERVTDGLFFIHQISDLVSIPDIDSYDFSQLRTICLSGSVFPDGLRRKAQKLTRYITNCYGMTETLGTFFSHPLDLPHVLRSAAVYPIGGTEVKIVDKNGHLVPINTMGELHFRGFSVFMYYCGNEEKTKEAKDDNGWLHTGDLAAMDEDGYVKLMGRSKDIIIKQAVNLAPMELEAVLYQHQDIKGALVAGVPDERTGEEVCAFVILKEGSKLTEDDVKEFCCGKVYSLLVPKYVFFVNQFPTTETGKYSRMQLTEMAVEKLHL